ncbi:MAG: hypothetical protein IBX55_01425 [Methyloprofundus sp.]|nr:hypothetical protein [Methyloprofundus sp.]
MPQQYPGGDSNGMDIVLYIVVAAILLIGLVYFISSNSEFFAITMFTMAYYLAWPFQFIPYLYDQTFAEISSIEYPEYLTVSESYAYLHSLSLFYAVPFFFITLWLGYKHWINTGISEKLIHNYNMDTLLKHNAKMFPWLAPIANRKKSILDEPYDTGGWATPRLPIQWAAKHDLLLFENKDVVPYDMLIDKKTGLYNEHSDLIVNQDDPNYEGVHLDWDKGLDLIKAQYSRGWDVPIDEEGFLAMPDYHQGMVAALMAFSAGGKKSKNEALNLFNQMSASFIEGSWKEDLQLSEDYKINSEGALDLFVKYKDQSHIKRINNLHGSFYYPWMIALISAARDKGVLEASKFIWLRPTETLLFDCLNQAGGNTAWVSALGAWSHYVTENTFGQTISDSSLTAENALKHIDWYLSDTGWYKHPKVKNQSAQAKEEELRKEEKKKTTDKYRRA